MDATFKRIDGTTHAVIVNGTQVGTITKHEYEEARPIKGTTLRHAKGRKAVRYVINLRHAAFTDSTHALCGSRFDASPRTLTAAKADTLDRLAKLTLKPVCTCGDPEMGTLIHSRHCPLKAVALAAHRAELAAETDAKPTTPPAPVAGTAKASRRAQIDHRTECTHAQTPVARRACRKGNR